MDPHLRHRGVANWNKSEPDDAPNQWLLIRFNQSIGPFVSGCCNRSDGSSRTQSGPAVALASVATSAMARHGNLRFDEQSAHPPPSSLEAERRGPGAVVYGESQGAKGARRKSIAPSSAGPLASPPTRQIAPARAWSTNAVKPHRLTDKRYSPPTIGRDCWWERRNDPYPPPERVRKRCWFGPTSL